MEYAFFLLMCFMCVFSTNPNFKKAESCYVSVGFNLDYEGTQNKTRNGADCLSWRDTTWTNSDFDGSMQNNFCRNPDRDAAGPWCIVRNGRRQYCNVPQCASSARFDGTGNILHDLFSYEKSYADNISFAFYTNVEMQNDATLLTVKTFTTGQELNVKIQSSSGVNDAITLEWRFSRNKPKALLTSRPKIAANGDIVRVEIVREKRFLKMVVNGEEWSTVITDTITTDAVFDAPENIFIGRSPYGRNGFIGCISDFNYNDVRTIDIAMGSRVKPEDEEIQISRGVWEGCLLIPPSDYVVPEVVPTDSPSQVEHNANMKEVNARLNSNGTLDSGGDSSRTLSALLLLLLLVLIQ